MSRLSQAVLRTLAYAAVFGSGVRERELKRFLLYDQSFSKRELSEALKAVLPRNVVRRPVASQHALWRSVLQLRSTVSWIPWVQSVWITGSLAVGRAKAEDDIDCMIIVDPQRLWLARACLIVLGLLQGRLRTRVFPRSSWAGYWCCNLWMEPSAERLSHDAQTLYTAREVVQAIPVYRRRDARPQRFLEKNTWVQSWSYSGWQFARIRAHKLVSSPSSWIVSFVSIVPRFVWELGNEITWRLQSAFLRQHQTREVVAKDRAFFHPRDTRRQVQGEYERICAVLGVSPWPNARKH